VDKVDNKLTLTQAGAIAGCSHRTIMRAIQEYQLEAGKEHGIWNVDGQSLRSWIEARQSRGRRITPLEPALDFRKRILELECGTKAGDAHA
jgi:hypothetical protein